jgi:hypothetical protein
MSLVSPEEFKPAVIQCTNIALLGENTIAPPLKLGRNYPLNDQYTCKCGEVHLDVGLSSEEAKIGRVTCYKCKEVLPNSDKTYWCHSSRFVATDLKDPD